MINSSDLSLSYSNFKILFLLFFNLCKTFDGLTDISVHRNSDTICLSWMHVVCSWVHLKLKTGSSLTRQTMSYAAMYHNLFEGADFCIPQLYLWGSPFWVRYLNMWPFFNPTIEVVTFFLCAWCMLGVFLLLAFTCLGHECQDLLSPCDGMHVCMD